MENSNTKFCAWINSLRRFERIYFIRRISEGTHVTEATVKKWKEGTRPVPFAARYIVNHIAGFALFDLPFINQYSDRHETY